MTGGAPRRGLNRFKMGLWRTEGWAPLSPQPPLLLGVLVARTVGREQAGGGCRRVSPARTDCSGPSTTRDRGSRGWPPSAHRSLRQPDPASRFPDALREPCGKLTITVSPSLLHSTGSRAQKAGGSRQRPRRSEGWCQDPDPGLTNVRFEVSSFKPKREVERDHVFAD